MMLENRNRGANAVQRSREPSDAEKKDTPPPYTPALPRRQRNASGSTNKPAPPLPPQSSGPSPSVNQVHLQNGSEPISGTFYIDPKIPSLGFNAKGCKSRKKNPPHASFRTRQGEISLELATTGDVSDAEPKANILVASGSGNVSIKLLPTTAARPHIGLEVVSSQGNIIIFLPPNFSGAIHARTNKGSLHFLPALASAMKIMKETDDEAFVLLGDQSSSRSVNFCQLNSRSGKIIIGLSGQDKYEVKVGFWRKIVKTFGGE